MTEAIFVSPQSYVIIALYGLLGQLMIRLLYTI